MPIKRHFNPELHPRGQKGSPLGGKFIAKSVASESFYDNTPAYSKWRNATKVESPDGVAFQLNYSGRKNHVDVKRHAMNTLTRMGFTRKSAKAVEIPIHATLGENIFSYSAIYIDKYGREATLKIDTNIGLTTFLGEATIMIPR